MFNTEIQGSGNNMPVINVYRYGNNLDIAYEIKIQLFNFCIKNQKQLYSCEFFKNIKPIYLDKIEEFVENSSKKLEMKCLQKHKSDSVIKYIFSMFETVVYLRKAENNVLYVEIFSTNENNLEKIRKILSQCFLETERECIHTILVDNSGKTEITNIGKSGQQIVRENYSNEILSKYDLLVKNLSSVDPYGRLSIIDGEPGTGKSYLIRGLINQVENTIFLLVPSAIIPKLSSPQFMKTLLEFHNEKKLPIVLILEDADAALLPRGSDNMSTISDLLNFADGILGQIIDFRIVATTNAKKIEIEPALLRPGRINTYMTMGKLVTNHAILIFERLSGRKIKNEERKLFVNKTLAEVYDLAVNNKKDLIQNEPKYAKIGF